MSRWWLSVFPTLSPSLPGLSMCPADLASARSMSTPEPTSYLNHYCVNLEGWKKTAFLDINSANKHKPYASRTCWLEGPSGLTAFWTKGRPSGIKRKERLSVREPRGHQDSLAWLCEEVPPSSAGASNQTPFSRQKHCESCPMVTFY